MVGGGRLTVGGENMDANNKVAAKNYRDLIVWQDGIALAKMIYKLVRDSRGLRPTPYPINFAGRSFQCHRILRKDRRANYRAISGIFCILPWAPWQK